MRKEGGIMLKKVLNELRIKLDITTSGPLLIAEGKPESDNQADAERNNEERRETKPIQFVSMGNRVYIPGSSLKGVIRSYCERIARTLGVPCCDPLINDDVNGCSCGKKVETEKERRGGKIPVPEIYKNVSLSCLICKIFGSTGIASRFFIEDAYPRGNPNQVERKGIAIDRSKGAAQKGALFSLNTVTENAHFETEIHIRNFELWQIGLIGLALRNMFNGQIRIGFSKSRGLGKVKGKISELTISYPCQKLTDDKLKMASLSNGEKRTLIDGSKFFIYGVGSLIGAEGESYGYYNNDMSAIDTTKPPESDDSDWISSKVVYDDIRQIEPLFKNCVDQHWIRKCQDYISTAQES